MKYHEWIESRGYRLSAIVHREENEAGARPVVICCHGFTGDKVGANQLMLNLGKGIEAAGFAVVRFDFAGSGESEGEFASETTVSGWQEDLGNIVAWVRRQPEFAASPLYLLGHSLGGLIVLSSDLPDVTGRIVLAPVVRPLENFRDIILGPGFWDSAVSGQSIANFYGKGFRLNPGFVADLLERGYDPLADAVAYQQPILIVHGEEDVVVPLAGSRELYARYAGAKEFHAIGADHVFTGQHDVLKRLVTDWLQKQAAVAKI